MGLRRLGAALLFSAALVGCAARGPSNKDFATDDADPAPSGERVRSAESLTTILPRPIETSGDYAAAREFRDESMAVLHEIVGTTPNLRSIDRDQSVYLLSSNGFTKYFPEKKQLIFQRASDHEFFANLFQADAEVALVNIRMTDDRIVVTVSPSLRFTLERDSESGGFAAMQGWESVPPLDADAVERFALDAYEDLELWRSGRLAE
jgi:hypothetical protein